MRKTTYCDMLIHQGREESGQLNIKTFMHDSFSETTNHTIALFGEVLVDIFPDRQALGGAPFNVARHLRAFGLHPLLITRTGNDASRERFLDAMRRFDMDTRGVQRDDHHPTGQVQVHIKKKNHVFEILPQQAYDFIDANTAYPIIRDTAPTLFYFGTLAQRDPISRAALTSLIDHTNTPTFLDINLRAPWYDEQVIRNSLHQADIVKLNNEELAVIAELFRLPGSATTQAQQLIDDFSLRELIITYGVNGARVYNSDGAEARVDGPTIPLNIMDTVGAGDGFTAVFIMGMLRDWPITLTLERANHFAGAICGIRGAVPENHHFYLPFMDTWKINLSNTT